MARITVEDCLNEESNRFSLVRLATKRAKQILEGKPTVTDTKNNKAIVSALREIADGKVRFKDDGYDILSGEDELTANENSLDEETENGLASH